MKFEDFNNFQEYLEANQRWTKNPNDTNAGYLLAMAQSLLNQAFLKQREEEAENKKVLDTDADARDYDKDTIGEDEDGN